MRRILRFTEVTTAGVQQASMRVPAGTLVRVTPIHLADWGSSTSAVLNVTAGDEVLINDVDLKAAGPYTPGANGFQAAADAASAARVGLVQESDEPVTVTAKVTTVGGGATTGRTHVLIETEQPRYIDVLQ